MVYKLIKNTLQNLPKTFKYSILTICSLTFLTLNFGIGPHLLIKIITLLHHFTHYYFLLHLNTVDYLLVAFIPFFAMMYSSKRKPFKRTIFLKDLIFLYGIIGIVFVMGLYFMVFIGKPQNPLIPQYFLSEPYNSYTITLLLLGILIPFMFLKTLKK